MAHDTPALCALRDVTKCYARRTAPALGPISLSVSGGEILGIRGPNGAGKSTLLEILAGVLRPSKGERRCTCRVGYVPQELSLYSSLTGVENLRFWGLAQGLSGKTSSVRARWLLGELELSGKGDAPVSTLSGGMKRRLHLATALMTTPELLLLDEPTVGADDPSAALILALLGRLAGQGCGIVLTSHRAGELENCSRILTLEAGKPVREEVRPWER